MGEFPNLDFQVKFDHFPTIWSSANENAKRLHAISENVIAFRTLKMPKSYWFLGTFLTFRNLFASKSVMPSMPVLSFSFPDFYVNGKFLNKWIFQNPELFFAPKTESEKSGNIPQISKCQNLQVLRDFLNFSEFVRVEIGDAKHDSLELKLAKRTKMVAQFSGFPNQVKIGTS